MAKRKKKSIFSVKTVFIAGLIIAAGYYLWNQYDLYTNNGFHQKLIENRPPEFNHFGIDVSHHQGEIDWNEVFITQQLDSIIDFVYFKVSEGVDHCDTKWQFNRKELQKFNKSAGAYHFYLPKKNPELQAAHFLKHYSYKKGDLPPAIDIELEGVSDELLRKNVLVWMKIVQQKTGIRPIIYTSLHFFETKFAKYFPNERFWIASYSRMPPLDDKRITIWQYSESGKIKGFEEYIDLNVGKPF